LQKGRLTAAIAVFGTDSSSVPGRPAPVGCCDYNRRSAQLAPTHPGSAHCFPTQGSPGLPVTQYSSVRSCCYPPSSQDRCSVTGSRCGRRQRRLRPGRSSFRWLPPGSFRPTASCVRRDGSACPGQRPEAFSASVAIIILSLVSSLEHHLRAMARVLLNCVTSGFP
jgi:hypothetical protein